MDPVIILMERRIFNYFLQFFNVNGAFNTLVMRHKIVIISGFQKIIRITFANRMNTLY